MDCRDCEFCKTGSSAAKNGTLKFRTYFCRHPNQKQILRYFVSHRLKNQVGYIGRGNFYSSKPDVEKAPAWCPKRGDFDANM